MIPLLGIYPEKTLIPEGICTPKFTAALSTIAKTKKQPKKCPSTDEWIKKIWGVCVCVCVYTQWHITQPKKRMKMLFAMTWIDLELIILTEVSQIK